MFYIFAFIRSAMYGIRPSEMLSPAYIPYYFNELLNNIAM